MTIQIYEKDTKTVIASIDVNETVKGIWKDGYDVRVDGEDIDE